MLGNPFFVTINLIVRQKCSEPNMNLKNLKS